jgi:POT family proton-dependent oligopeptide transporter
MGVNVGAALGTILVGYLGETLGWSRGFGLAGIGMALGLVIFITGKRALMGHGEPPRPLARPLEWRLYGIGAAAVGAIWLLLQYQDAIGSLLAVSGVAMLAYTLYEAFKLPREARDRIFAILFLIALNPIFWGFYEQAGGSLVAPDVEHRYSLPEGMKYEVGKGLSKLPPADAAPAAPGAAPGLPKAFQGGKL